MSVLNAVSGCSFVESVLSAVPDRGGSPRFDGAFTATCKRPQSLVTGQVHWEMVTRGLFRYFCVIFREGILLG